MARTKKADQEAAPQETKSIEETFRELEAIVEQMESGLRLDKVEKQIMVLAEDGGDYESQ